jgi:hypothetical protein
VQHIKDDDGVLYYEKKQRRAILSPKKHFKMINEGHKAKRCGEAARVESSRFYTVRSTRAAPRVLVLPTAAFTL